MTSNGVDTLFDIVDDTIPVATRRSGGNTAYMVFPNWDVLLQTILTSKPPPRTARTSKSASIMKKRVAQGHLEFLLVEGLHCLTLGE